MEDLTGKQLGAYQILAPLGEGGMAAVFKAYQLGKINRYVALKVLPQQLAKNPEFLGRFNQEANILAKLQHPRILPVFDFGEAEGYTYIVMPFVDHGTLADRLHGKALPLPQVRSFTMQVAEALDYAHACGLVHRDVKPSNVLVDERGNCLLSDFGISKILEGTEKFTLTGGIVGTPAYMSPEQGRGDALDARSDIYSVGVMLYEMATGRVPFRAETPLAVILKHIQDPLPLPRSINSDLPEAVEQVILKALAKQREDRYQTAGELAQAIQAAIPETVAWSGQAQESAATLNASGATLIQTGIEPPAPTPPVSPVKPPAPMPAKAPVEPPKWILSVSGLALIVVIAAGVFIGLILFTRAMNRVRRTPTPKTTVDQAVKLTVGTAAPLLTRTLHPSPRLKRTTIAPLTEPPSTTAAEQPAVQASAAPLSLTAAQAFINADSIAGKWIGTINGEAANSSTTIYLSIQTGCTVGHACGTVSVPHAPCSGSIELLGVYRGVFVFVERNMKGASSCVSGGFEYLQLRSDGMLVWALHYTSSSGDKTVSKGVLKRP